MFYSKTAAEKLTQALSTFEQAKQNALEAVELVEEKIRVNRAKIHDLTLDNDGLYRTKNVAIRLVESITKLVG